MKEKYSLEDFIQKLALSSSEIIFDDETDCVFECSIKKHCLTISDNQNSVSIYL